MKQPSRVLIVKPMDSRRKNLSQLSLLDPSPKQGRKQSIQLQRQKENIPEQQRYKSGPTDELKKQISQLIKTSNRSHSRKLDIVCEELIDVDELKNFQTPHECPFDENTMRYLYAKEHEYRVSPTYFDHQNQITAFMRAILIDWLMEVCKEFTLKRETLHLTVHNLDRYLMRTTIHKADLQLVGLACLYIACKLEEIYPPKVSDFSQASNYGFSATQIMEKELQVISTLKWLLNPPTLYLWSTWYMSQWDLYYTHKGNKMMSLKNPTQQSYTLFRQYIAFIDCAVLDIKIYQYTHREVVASLMYLVLLKQFTGCTFQRISETKVIDREMLEFQQMYKPFVEMVFGFQYGSLAKCIRFMAKFLLLEVTVDQPNSSKIPAEREYEEAYEYFLSIQTHNQANLQFIRK